MLAAGLALACGQPAQDRAAKPAADAPAAEPWPEGVPRTA